MKRIMLMTILCSVIIPILLLPFPETLSQIIGRPKYEAGWLLYFIPIMQTWYLIILLAVVYYYVYQWHLLCRVKARKRSRLFKQIILQNVVFSFAFWAIYIPASFTVFFRFNWIDMLQNLHS